MAAPTIQDALDTAVRSVSRLPGAPSARPVSPPILVLSAVAIALAAVAIAALAAMVVVLVVYIDLGRDGFADLTIEARFNPWLKARLAAFAVSALYVGVTLATLAAARRRGDRASWSRLLAAGPGHWRRRDALPIALATLGYATVFTFIQVAGRERYLPISGPTDFVLLGALAGNLVILAPCAEELFFRGWVYTALRARWRFGPAFMVTAATFAAIHWDADHRHMLRVLPLAFAVGLLRELTGSIRPAIALHSAYNLVIVAITLGAP